MDLVTERKKLHHDKWVDNIRMDLKQRGCNEVDWIELAQDRDRDSRNILNPEGSRSNTTVPYTSTTSPLTLFGLLALPRRLLENVTVTEDENIELLRKVGPKRRRNKKID
ncbi:unnamed protein product [Timema podura]|uniref:Uncharacterized protein n=1 Tax=Timema podura TaxID=61482 RepID=A0ABN7NU08_TIMPD|nr:unnamed protein product [Timema podura]